MRHQTRDGLLAGAVAGSLFVAVSIGLGLLSSTPSLPELLSDRTLELTPGPVFSFVLDIFQTAAKPLFYLGIVLALIAIGALAGAYIGRQSAAQGKQAGPSLLSRSLLAALVLWLFEEVVVLPLAGAGFFGLTTPDGVTGAALRLVGFLVYGIALAGVLSLLQPDVAFMPSRRNSLRYGTLGVLGLIAAGGLYRVLSGVSEVGAISRVTRRKADGLPEAVTPVDEFYSVSKNFIDPVVDKASWTLTVDGDVDTPATLRYEQVRALPQYGMPATLTCISNEVGGDLISNGEWRGVRLGELLSRAGVHSGAVKVAFECADNYIDTISLDKAMEPTTLLALDLNGEPLNDKHGAPLRCVVPNIYGMKNAKWIRRISVISEDLKGFWQRQGWSDPAIIKTMSRIDYPIYGETVPPEEVELGGIAFAGSRGISRVEVSFDDGGTWQNAELRDEIAPLSWRFWTIRWTPPKTGRYEVMVRATDGTGAPQISTPASPFPDGSSGYHRIPVQVA